DRVDAVAGDFFQSVPPADLYVLKMILHDWDDDRCVQILENCRDAMNPGGRIAIVETVVGEPGDPGPAALIDMNMLAVAPRPGRPLAEYGGLLSAAGLRGTALIATRSAQSVIEAA